MMYETHDIFQGTGIAIFNHIVIKVRENRRGNQERTIQRNWQYRVHITQYQDKQNKNTTQKAKRMSNTEPTKNPGAPEWYIRCRKATSKMDSQMGL